MLRWMCGNSPQHLLDVAVDPDWIDYNGHMNVGYYVVAFDRGTDALIDELGMDAEYRARTGCTVYVLETHVCYLSELKLGDRMSVDVQLLDFDEKRLHYFMGMHRLPDGETAASCEIMLMHVDQALSRGAPMPRSVLERVAALAARHAALPQPKALGRPIGIRRK